MGNGASLAGPTITVSLTQPLSGVTAAAFTASSAMKTAFQTAVATAAGVAPSAITISGNNRRNLLQSTTVAYTVTTANPSATTSSLASTLTSAATASAIGAALSSAAGTTVTVTAATATAPTGAPITIPSSPSSPSSSPSTCFAATEHVTLESGAVKALPDVRVGDRVLSVNRQGEAVYSDVVYLPHGANNHPATFAQIGTESGRDLKMTTDHILPAGACALSSLPLVAAASIAVGDCVQTVSGREQVVSVGKVEARGIYTIIAMEELIVVNGIVATPFGGVNPTLANTYYNLHRLAYAGCGASFKSLNAWVQGVMEGLWTVLSALPLVVSR